MLALTHAAVYPSLEHTSAVSKELTKLMMIPVDSYDDVSTLLKLTHYSALIDYFDYEARKSLGIYIINNALELGRLITTTEQVDSLLTMLSPLVCDQKDQPDEDPDPEDFAEEQSSMARFISLFQAESPDQQNAVCIDSLLFLLTPPLLTPSPTFNSSLLLFQILTAARKHFGTGGNNRVKYTLPVLVFAAFKLAYQFKMISEEVSAVGAGVVFP